ncbi:type II secretion system minor pseudopilin GspH [Bowmanella yangjiangensis]|uniref:Type II secretion system protein H n=1 Tax=Bowmanella yangjiangensis TaxID=2811230 RepID=A0ABS3CPY7_9ALTE|nr:type II secretion system minor pseudopilin GspH [Bowmanella yangjiangensis]MBN7819168.1 type II secretion system minor pseudopilin GspH [Bowmanella yangjiangensis]
MPGPHPHSSRYMQGFTLLEVMLVLLLMGLIVSTVTFTALGKSAEQQLEEQARRFAVVVNMASDFAVLNQQELGLRIEEDRYYFVRLDDEQQWQRIEQDKVFEQRELDETVSLALELDNLPWQDDESLFDQQLFDETLSVSEDGVEIGEEEEKLPPPQVLLLSSGEITPFSLTFQFEPTFGNEQPVAFRVDAMDMPPLRVSDALDNP